MQAKEKEQSTQHRSLMTWTRSCVDADSRGLGMKESAEDSEVFLKFLMRRFSLGEAPAAGTVLSRWLLVGPLPEDNL